MSKLNYLKKYFVVLIGSIIFAAGLEFFLIPNNILDGGVVGLSIIAYHYIKIPLGIFIFILNIPFLYLGYKQIGLQFTLASIFGVVALSISTSLFHPYPPLVTNPFLACVFGGIILGIGVGLVIRSGGTLDGSEMFSIFITRKLPISVGEMVLVINVGIFIISGFIFGWEAALYSMISYFIASKVMDTVIEGLNDSKSVMIISKDYDAISKAIQKQLGRGVTLLIAEGGYSGDKTKVVFCVITRIEESILKEIVTSIDKNAFLSMGNIAEVSGANFKKRDIH
ncbi:MULTISPECIES: YitT family protein [unclassified Gemella]|uniref:YitT family protein n=1 Tax=unclassified Gemella TaxID=2624949 RepID=UPI001C059A0C|nr:MULTISPECIES: YitT family protein [unclassified Gemella]MBU0278944.1 YitT family protein [Gemella sp. zg-1178]QWQ39053.1 YitT family protein [Gemella sp. zg-570]